MKNILKSLRQIGKPVDRSSSELVRQAPSSPAMLDVSKGIYLCGFARGGTTWARQVISSHPDIYEVPRQVLFRARTTADFTAEMMSAKLRVALDNVDDGIEQFCAAKRFVTKAPPNSEFLLEMMRAVPSAIFLYIVRDPRDVLVSHQRTGVAWTEAHRDFDMAAERTRGFYEGYLRARPSGPTLFKYEDLHQQFPSTFSGICDHIGVETPHELVDEIMRDVSFKARTGRSHEEKPGMNRRGVVGDWSASLTYSDAAKFSAMPFWVEMMAEHGYDWRQITLGSLLKEAAAQGLPAHRLDQGTMGGLVLWSLSDADWAYPPAVGERCRTALAASDAAGYPSLVMLGEEIPDKAVKALAPVLQGRPVALEVDVDKLESDEEKPLSTLMDACFPQIKEITGSVPRQSVVYGDTEPRVSAVAAQLRSHGLDSLCTRGTGSNFQFPVGMLRQTESAVITSIGLPESFDLREENCWTGVKDRLVVFLGKLAAVPIDAPLSLGFRDEFTDLRAVGK